MTRKWWLIAAILLGGWGALELMMYQSGLGDYARSPQRVELAKDRVALVGGGRAGLTFEERRRGDKARLGLRCDSVDETLTLSIGEPVMTGCGVEIELLAVDLRRASLEVRWDEEAMPSEPNTEPASPTDRGEIG
ncbi:MAG: hypothetical protein AAGN46_11465 [Acidobacteriota bacterium]